ncbi:DUF6680 family protein [Cupriavidus basilensis]
MAQMGLNEWLVIGSTLLGPVLAVQAQKWVERARDASNRRNLIFTTLMATRQARLSIEHVRALNSIDLAFYGQRFLGFVMRGARAQAVLDAWHDYHAHLNLPPERRPQNDAEQRDWTGRGDELFTNLLDRLATATNFKFDRDQLKAGSYSPEAHGTVELEQQAMRRLTLDILLGNKSLPMEVKSWPVDDDVVEQQRNVQAQLVENQRAVMDQLIEILNRLTSGHNVGGDRVNAVTAAPQANQQ